MHQVSKPRAANHSITEECGRPGHLQVEGRLRSHRGAVHEEDRAPRRRPGGALRQRKSRTVPASASSNARCRASFAFLSKSVVSHYKNPLVPEEEHGSMGIDIGTWIRFRSCCCTTRRCAAERPAIREKDLGIWQTWTWSEVARRGARARLRASPRTASSAAITSRSSATTGRACTGPCPPRSAWAAFPCPSTRTRWRRRWCSSSRTPRSRSRVVEDQEQVDKLLEILPQCPTLEAHLLRRPARPAPLQAAGAGELRRRCSSAGARRWRARSRLPRGGDREGHGRRHRDHALHLGHHRQRRRAWCSRTTA